MSHLRVFVGLLFLCVAQVPALNSEIYDTKTDGKKLIASALNVAKKENKHVLLDFGANWCPECRSLHGLFQSNTAIREKLNASYILVMIDTNEDRNTDVNRNYGTPTLRGLPVLVVLDPEGKHIFTQETGAFLEGKKLDPEKVIAFLNKW